MRKLCPNFDREDGLDTVLEVPIPEEMFASNKHGNRSWQNMKAWMRPHNERSVTTLFGGKNAEIQLLLGVVGAPLIPLPILCDHQFINRNIKDHPIESSMAKYIVQQYIAAVGGERALNSVDSMYAMGKVKMVASEFCAGEGSLKQQQTLNSEESETWSAGSDGKVAWRQTPWHHSHASRGPPRPLRRFLQGLDPKSTANLFSNSVCTGEKTINNEDCFVLKLEAEPPSLRARSTSNVEIIRHTVWGYFSQRTGLLVQLEDSHLLRIKASGNDGILWETTWSHQNSRLPNHRWGINIAYRVELRSRCSVFGEEPSESHSRTRMEEIWAIEEVDFNIKGLSMDCFLPPSDLKKEEEGCDHVAISNSARLPFKIRSASSRFSVSKVVAIDDVDDSDEIYDEDDDRE
uniref:Uncharacterized protein n=1 Tax=Populus alba TaxID=43335 RepID=A0A4U5R1H3_POPAL|nr:uncharacterized protein D5086_0000015600 [Populus alba]